jgi:hypothetical protein
MSARTSVLEEYRLEQNGHFVSVKRALLANFAGVSCQRSRRV